MVRLAMHGCTPTTRGAAYSRRVEGEGSAQSVSGERGQQVDDGLARVVLLVNHDAELGSPQSCESQNLVAITRRYDKPSLARSALLPGRVWNWLGTLVGVRCRMGES